METFRNSFLPVYRFLSDHLSQKLWSSHPSLPPDPWTHSRKQSVSAKPHPGLSLWKRTVFGYLDMFVQLVYLNAALRGFKLTDSGFNCTFIKQNSKCQLSLTHNKQDIFGNC